MCQDLQYTNQQVTKWILQKFLQINNKQIIFL